MLPLLVTTVRLVVFLLTYALIAVQQFPGLRLNRPAASLLGAVAMVTVGGLPLGEAYAAIDLNVIVFLLGVLLLTAYLELGGFFEWAATWIVARVRSPRALLAAIVASSGLLSALFINDTICLVFTPLLVPALRALGLRPLPFLLALAFAANVGSALTITGNPQNMLIGVSSGIHYGAFAAALALPTVGGLAIVYGVIRVAFRRDLAVALVAAPLAEAPLDRPLVLKALALFGAALAGWLAGLSLPLVAIAAGAVMVAIAGRDPDQAFARVEWSLLLFFAALFIVVRGVRDLPLFVDLTTRASGALVGAPWHDATVIAAAMTALSNLVSNVPAVMLWRPVVPTVPNAELAWLAMAMSSTFAGNLTVLGSMANLIVAERAAARGVRIGFREVLRVGVPVTLLTLAWGIASLVLVRG
ncbi:MAG TPA: SLC13 family permease [Gemmatimonadaceae bacterium]